jgi:hypothetical protein
MNWKEIENKYPKAFNLLSDKYGKVSAKLMLNSNERELYDFFDDNGISIIIDVDYYDGLMFIPCIFSIKNHQFDPIDNYDSRKEAEFAAFTRAFELLEDKTKQITQ